MKGLRKGGDIARQHVVRRPWPGAISWLSGVRADAASRRRSEARSGFLKANMGGISNRLQIEVFARYAGVIARRSSVHWTRNRVLRPSLPGALLLRQTDMLSRKRMKRAHRDHCHHRRSASAS
jgi:hypothetical protein